MKAISFGRNASPVSTFSAPKAPQKSDPSSFTGQHPSLAPESRDAFVLSSRPAQAPGSQTSTLAKNPFAQAPLQGTSNPDSKTVSVSRDPASKKPKPDPNQKAEETQRIPGKKIDLSKLIAFLRQKLGTIQAQLGQIETAKTEPQPEGQSPLGSLQNRLDGKKFPLKQAEKLVSEKLQALEARNGTQGPDQVFSSQGKSKSS